MFDIYEFQFDKIPEIATINNFNSRFIVNNMTHEKISNAILNQNNNVDKVIDRLEKIIKYRETIEFLYTITNEKETKWYKVENNLHWKL